MPKWEVKEVVEQTNELLPPGEYNAVVKAASQGLVQAGKHTGADKIELRWRVDDRATVRDNLIFVESLRWKLDKFVAACRISAPGECIELDANNVVGKECLVRIGVRDITKQDGSAGKVNTIDGYALAPVKMDDSEDFV